MEQNLQTAALYTDTGRVEGLNDLANRISLNLAQQPQYVSLRSFGTVFRFPRIAGSHPRVIKIVPLYTDNVTEGFRSPEPFTSMGSFAEELRRTRRLSGKQGCISLLFTGVFRGDLLAA